MKSSNKLKSRNQKLNINTRLSVPHSMKKSPQGRNIHIVNASRASEDNSPMEVIRNLKKKDFNTVSLPSINKSPQHSKSVLNIIDYSQTQDTANNESAIWNSIVPKLGYKNIKRY